MARILVIRFSSLGDVAMALPTVDALVSRGEEVHFLTKHAFVPVLEAYGGAAHIHWVSDHASLRELVAESARLRALGFERVVDLHRNIRSWIVGGLVGRPIRRIRKFRIREWALFLLRRLAQVHGGIRIDRRQEALRAAGVVKGPFNRQCLLNRTPALASHLLESIQSFQRGFVCVAAESAWRQKEWPLERFVSVARSISQKGYGVVWVGQAELPETARFEGALDATGRTSLGQAAALLAQARLLVCNDSGLMHLAEVCGTPVVAVFGPTCQALGFGPRMPTSRVVETDLWCRPCSKTGRWCVRPIERRKCLTDIGAQEVVDAALAVLESHT